MAESKSYSYQGDDKPILPYRSFTSPIDTSPHFQAGSYNSMALADGYLRKRPGFATQLFGVAVPHGTIRRQYIWERWDGTFFYVVSTTDAVNAYVYQAQIGLDTQFALLFQQNNSTQPFDFVVSRNLLFFGNGSPGSMMKWDGGGSLASATATVAGGAVTALTLSTPGQGYFTVPKVTLTGVGTGATATASIVATVTQIQITNGGFGYTSAPTVTLTSPIGTGATATATVANGAVTAITVTSGGSGYTFAPTVIITGGGSTGGNASAIATIAFQVAGLTLTAPGTGYTVPPAVIISGGGRLTSWGVVAPTAPPTFTFSGAAGATAVAYISSPVTSVTMTAAGSGYTTAPTVTFTGGGGSGASGTATIALDTSGVTYMVTGVIITNGGGNYTSAPTVTFSGAGGSGAAANANVTNIITSITVTNTGSGYTSTPTVTITGGGGSGATATATITSGLLSAITVNNGGSGYTSAPTVTISGGGGTGATASPNLSYQAVSQITVTAGGTGYNQSFPPVVSFSGGSGSGAAANAVVNSNGVVTGITITAGGSGYTTAPTVTISAGGLSAYTNYYWGYTYTTIYGHESNMSPLSAASGLFTSRISNISYSASADAQVNGINIYRTTDGGSTAPDQQLQVFSVPNLNSTYADSTTDAELGIITGPAYYANTPPTPCYGFVYWNNRIWGFKDGTTYYSGAEEIANGVPEEAWPGQYNSLQQGDGNYQTWPQKVRGLGYTTSQLAIGLAPAFWQFSGNSLDTFRLSPLVQNRGVRGITAIASFGSTVAWFDRSRQFWLADEGEIGKAIRTDLLNVDPAQAYVGMHVQGPYHWIYLLDPANAVLYTYDVDLDQWNTPWTVPGAVAIISGEIAEGNPQLFIAFANGIICSFTPTSYVDNGTPYADTLITNAMGITAGGDSTARNRDLVGQVQQMEIETNTFLPSYVALLNDDLPSSPTAAWSDISTYGTPPLRRRQGTALIKTTYKPAPANNTAERVTVQLQWASSINAWALYSLDMASIRSGQ